MRIAVLSRNAALYSTSRLVRAGRARGHDVDVIDPLDLQIVVAGGKPSLAYQGQSIPTYDAIVPRIGVSVTHYGVAVLRELERQRIPVINGSEAITLARDKVRMLGVLSQHRMRVPRTVAMHSLSGAAATVALVGGCPAVVKLSHGTQGVGTMIAESRAALGSLLETLWAMGHEIVIQEFVKGARGRDLRVLVVGGRIIAAMRRTAPLGEFRANIHRGASAEAVTLDADYARAAIKAAKLSCLHVAGVDMLQTRTGPVVIEVNSSPGLEGIEGATGVDVAGAVILHAERTARRPRGKSWGASA